MDADLAEIRKRDRMKNFAKRVMPVPLSVRTGDLPKRAASAVVMLAVAGTAFWLGGNWLDLFIGAVALATACEFIVLVLKATSKTLNRACGLIAGLAYIGTAGFILINTPAGLIFLIIGTVIFVDTFAYFFGRTLGGPKIAPRISPSKTWAGLLGGALGAASFQTLFFQFWPAVLCPIVVNFVDGAPNPYAFDHRCDYAPWNFDFLTVVQILGIGLIIAVIAQSGDFFESWLKRKAGVKDSSNLIPGHGGVFDRVDGLLPVVITVGAIAALAVG